MDSVLIESAIKGNIEKKIIKLLSTKFIRVQGGIEDKGEKEILRFKAVVEIIDMSDLQLSVYRSYMTKFSSKIKKGKKNEIVKRGRKKS